MKIALFAVTVLASILLLGCDPNMGKVTEPPELMATSPDGTKLWKVHVNGDGDVYFSSLGASWETTRDQGDGNISINKHHTPNAVGAKVSR